MAQKTIKKVYIPIDAIERHEDFTIWYEDGYDFCTVHSEGDWKSEKDRIMMRSCIGGMIAYIKPDFRALTYDIQCDRYTYTLKPYTIFKHYHFQGMQWQMYGSPSDGKAHFLNEMTIKKDVYVFKVDGFKGHGPCYEVRVRDLNKLRPAVAAIVGILIKEHWRGLSIGEDDPTENLFIRLKKFVLETGYTPEQIEEREKTGHNVIEVWDREKLEAVRNGKKKKKK